MKKSLLCLMMLVVVSLNAQISYVPFDQVKQIADQNAQSMWGDVHAAEPMAYYSEKDELLGYRFTYSINVPFPDKEILDQRCREAHKLGDKRSQWGIDEYGTIFVSARKDIGVIQDFTKALPPHYAFGFMLEDIAREKIGGNISLYKAYYIDFQNQWFCFTNGSKEIYIKLFPKVTAVEKAEFQEIIKPLYFFNGSGDFDEEWDKFLNQGLQAGKAEVWIPNHDGHCKFYDWSYGCSPTAAAMLLSYWDYVSLHYTFNYAKLIDYHYQRWDGIQGEWDYQVPNVNKELAIAMSTDTVVGGTTDRVNIAPGYASVCNTTNGYSFTCTHHNQGTDFVWYFNKIASEIGSYGRPVHISIPGHSECCVAYDAATNLIGVHNTWWEGVQWINRNNLERVYTIVPGGSTGLAVELTHPMGDVIYNHNGSGETFYAGSVYEIRWDRTSSSGSYARLFYSTNGGYTWTTIVANTPNDGKYDWVVPAISSTNCRIRINVYNSSNVFSGADGSIGNFKVYSGGSLPALSEDVAVTTSNIPAYFQFTNTANYWSVVGIRADDWDIELHNNTSFNDIIASSTYGGSTVDFVVIDGNHTPSVSRGIKAVQWSGASSARVEFEGGYDVVSVGSPLSTSWPANDVVEIYDVYLTPGKYGFILDVTSGTANLDFALYGSNGSAYYAGRSAYLAMSASGGSGGDEYFTYTVTTADWYGLCLWANDANSANYTLRVEAPGTWTGLVSTNWNNANNWSGNILPDATLDVTIPSGTPYNPYIYAAVANCKSLTINTGATLTVGGYALNVAGNLTISGTLASNNATGEINVQGNVVWNSGSTANFSTTAPFRVYGDWEFLSGSNANLANGGVLFMGNTDNYVRNYSATSSFNNIGSYKSGGAVFGISYLSTQPLTINGFVYVHPGATFGIYSTYDVILKGDINSNGTFLCNYGKVVLDGSTQNLKMNTGNYFNNLTFSQTGTVTINNSLSSVLDVNGNVVIESGVFNMQDRTMYVGGDWTNTAGTAAFVEGTGRVVFDGGNYHQYCSTETFNILEVNKTAGAAFRVNGGTVTCAQYDWSAGAVDVLSGTFTANDLADNGLYGAYYVNPGGTINLTNSGSGTWVDLCGELYNFGGVINISGSFSYWPFANGAHVTMTGGVIDLKTCGLVIHSGPTWTHNITGGTIRTACGYSGNRADFAPSTGTFEFYGSGDFIIAEVAGSTLPNVKINKEAAKDGDAVFEGPLFDERSGMLLSGGDKANTIILGSNFAITGNLNIEAGTFSLGSYTCNVGGVTNINGTLKMNNSGNDLTSYQINWNSGSNDDVTAGTFHAQHWAFYEGTNAKLGTGNTAYVYNLYYPTDDDAEFGNLVAVPSSKLLEGGEKDKAYYPVRVMGNFAMQGTSWYFTNSAVDLIVSGNSDIPYGNTLYFTNGADFYTNGTLNLGGTIIISDGGVATLHGELTFPSTGYLALNNSSFICDQNSASGSVTLNGILQMNSGSVFEMSGRNVIIGPSFIDDFITGGILRFGRSLTAGNPNNFQLNWGDVEMMSSNSGHYMDIGNGNYVNHLIISKGSASIYLLNHLTMKGYFTLNSGIFNSNNKNMYVGGNWTNNVGPGAFLEQTGTVFFNGSGDFNHQQIFGETFYNLTNAKTGNGHLLVQGPVTVTNTFLANGVNFVSANLNVNGLLNLSAGELGLTMAAPAVNVNNFTMGGILSVPAGSFTCTDLTHSGILGNIYLSGGSIILNQIGNQFTDLQGNLNITGGSMTVNGTHYHSVWGFGGIPASLTMSDGVLDFNNPGIAISMSWPVTISITGGLIRTSGRFYIDLPGFHPSNGTVEMYGGSDVYLGVYNGAYLYNLNINKSGGVMLGFNEPKASANPEMNEITRESLSDRPAIGMPSERSGNTVYTNFDVKVNNNTVISSGILNIQHVVNNTGNFTVNSGGKLAIEGLGSLAMGSGKTITVNNGGELALQGNVTDFPKITRISGNYGLNVESGATIGAEYAIFEYMNTNGINVKAGAVVNPAKSFSNCILRNGQSGGRLLALNNSQSILLSSVSFPGSSGNFNVSKTVNSGVVVLTDYSGSFGVPAYEQDPNNRIHWTGVVSPTVNLDGLLIGFGMDICFEASQTITVGGTQSFEVANGANVNLIAGQNVKMLPGAKVNSGGYLHAWITTSGNYCSNPLPLVAVNEEDLMVVPEIEINPQGGFYFNIYPNPTNGVFKIELFENDEYSTLYYEIFDVMGKMIWLGQLPSNKIYTFNISDQQPGVYFVRVYGSNKAFINKLIKNQ